MTIEKLKNKIADIDKKLNKLENKDYYELYRPDFGDFLTDGYEKVTDTFPIIFLPALFAVDLFEDYDRNGFNTTAGFIAFRALSSILALPCFALTALLSLPFFAVTFPASGAINGTKGIVAATHNKRVNKIFAKIEKLKKEKEELEKELKKEEEKELNKTKRK